MRLSRYSDVTAGDVGGGVGTAIGTILRTYLPLSTGGTPDQATWRGPGQPPWMAGATSSPSWWSQQTTGTKVLVGGVAFLGAAVGLVALRAKLKR